MFWGPSLNSNVQPKILLFPLELQPRNLLEMIHMVIKQFLKQDYNKFPVIYGDDIEKSENMTHSHDPTDKKSNDDKGNDNLKNERNIKKSEAVVTDHHDLAEFRRHHSILI